MGIAASFESDFIRIQLQSSGIARFDELQMGDFFADVSKHTPEPDSFTLMALGLVGLAVGRHVRR